MPLETFASMCLEYFRAYMATNKLPYNRLHRRKKSTVLFIAPAELPLSSFFFFSIIFTGWSRKEKKGNLGIVVFIADEGEEERMAIRIPDMLSGIG